MAKFVVFEKVAEAIYKRVDKNSISDGAKTGINLGSGLIAGFAAAIVSQPADTMLSKINKTKGLPGEGTTSRLIKIAKELGLRGSYTGIGARLFMVGTLTAGQFAIYGGKHMRSDRIVEMIIDALQISSVFWARPAELRSPPPNRHKRPTHLPRPLHENPHRSVVQHPSDREKSFPRHHLDPKASGQEGLAARSRCIEGRAPTKSKENDGTCAWHRKAHCLGS